MTVAIDDDGLDIAREFLELDLRDSADEQRDRAEAAENLTSLLRYAAADRLDELADEVADLSTDVLLKYALARKLELELTSDGPQVVQCSMSMEVGFAVNPKNIEDLVCIYVNTVECFRHSRFGDMADYWADFAAATKCN